MIRGFRDKETEKVFLREKSRKLGPEVQRIAQRKLGMLDAAEVLEDLRVPPGNRLEKLTGDREGQHSIRINDQWRICFRWEEGNAYDVEITAGAEVAAGPPGRGFTGRVPQAVGDQPVPSRHGHPRAAPSNQ